ncbi:hypothetical protein [Variovorax soli]|uniref:Uncharacterized protein n=1 Tax=Variovorax soli TaxID=376815 RepID=A0ABU1NML6_9BURK|nr:hypothetical protein [Variovorax soli]MDR6539659.1 hypothetical protein [Variovorax soli]
MLIRSFAEANWNPDVVAELHAAEGLEIIFTDLTKPISTKSAFAEITTRIDRVFRSAEYWVISGHEVSQPKTRIVDYRKFWKSTNIGVLSSSGDLAEWRILNAEASRYFGVARRSSFQEEDLLNLLENFSTTWILVLDGPHSTLEIASALHPGWEAFHYRCPGLLLEFVNKNDAILVRNFDADDVLESGAIVITKSTTIKRLFGSI